MTRSTCAFSLLPALPALGADAGSAGQPPLLMLLRTSRLELVDRLRLLFRRLLLLTELHRGRRHGSQLLLPRRHRTSPPSLPLDLVNLTSYSRRTSTTTLRRSTLAPKSGSPATPSAVPSPQCSPIRTASRPSPSNPPAISSLPVVSTSPSLLETRTPAATSRRTSSIPPTRFLRACVPGH